MSKRSLWIAAVVIVVVGVGAYLIFGRSPAATNTGAAAPSSAEATAPGPNAPSAAAQAAVKVAKKGAKLGIVAVPPTMTIAQIHYDAAHDKQRYTADFQPYGTGRIRGGLPTVVVKLGAFLPVDTTAKEPLQYATFNVLLEVGPGVTVATGGKYHGVVMLRREGQVITFELISAKAAK